MRYNPAGPGDYNLPSAFGELPPVKAPHETRSSFYKNRKHSVAVKANPSFSIGGRINNNQVIKSHMQKFQGIDTPGVGHYDPLKETFEDTHKKKLMKRLNMYNAGSSKFNKSHNAINNLLHSEPVSAQHNRSIQNSVAESRADSCA